MTFPNGRRYGSTLAAAWVAAILIAVASWAGPAPASAAYPGGNGKLLYWTYDPQVFDFDTSTGSRALGAAGYYPRYSADGSKIALSTIAGTACNLRVMDADGGNAVTITSATTCDYQMPSFSPDGTRLAFVRTVGEAYTISVIDVDGSDETAITAPAPAGGYYSFPTWSPDGQKIAFAGSMMHSGSTDIYVMDADGGNRVNLTPIAEGQHFFQSPDWAPDGSQLVFVQSSSGQEGWLAPGIWMNDVEGGNLHPVNLSNPGCPSFASAIWSPDGQKIAYSVRSGSCGPGSFEIHTMDPDGSHRAQLTSGSNVDKVVSDWQPSPAGGPVTVPQAPPLANTLRNVQGLDVAADGTMALVGVRSGEPDYGQTDLYVSPSGGGGLLRATFDNLSESIPSIANDHRVAYSPSGQSIVVRNGDGTGRVQVAPRSFNCGYAAPAISPDGSFVLYANYCGGVHHVDSDGTDDVLLPVPSTVSVYSGDISQTDSRFVGQCYDSATSQNGICAFDAADGSDFAFVLLNSDTAYWSDPSWSVDGGRLALTLYDGTTSTSDIYVANPDGSSPALVTTPDAGSKNLPRWLPNGDIAYVYLTSVDGTTSEVRTATPPDVAEDLDLDDDGVIDSIDTDGGSGADAQPGFTNVVQGRSNPTAGTVTSGAVTVSDLADPTKGVLISATADSALSVCGPPSAAAPSVLTIPAGFSITLTCGSVIVENVTGTGPGSVKVTVPGGQASVSFPAGTAGTVTTTATGGATVTNVTGSGVTLTVGTGAPVPVGAGGSLNLIVGRTGNDTINGTAGDDVIVGNGGNDTIDGKGGNDTITTGSGNDKVVGGAGNDTINAAAGNDELDGGDGNDTVNAGDGNNTVNGGVGNDSITAGSGNDTVDGGAGVDSCKPGAGANKVKNCETVT